MFIIDLGNAVSAVLPNLMYVLHNSTRNLDTADFWGTWLYSISIVEWRDPVLQLVSAAARNLGSKERLRSI